MNYNLLCSGVTLGTYIPALVLHKQLKLKGVNTRILLLEELYKKEKLNKLLNLKEAFHKDFRLAKFAQNVSESIYESLEDHTLKKLQEEWNNSQNSFLIFSGYWIPLIEKLILPQYKELSKYFACHMDTTISASWKNIDASNPMYKHVWLFSYEKNEISYYIDIANKEPLPFYERNNKVLVHGGGWGIGTYKSVIPDLNNKNISLDIIAYSKLDITKDKNLNNYYLLDPEWTAWKKEKDAEHTFPSLGKLCKEIYNYKNNELYSEVFNIISSVKAIISKPGGATLIDSLASCTPLIFLDPFGDYEQKNAELWTKFKIGMSYRDWKNRNYSFEELENMNRRLMELRPKLKNYIEIFH